MLRHRRFERRSALVGRLVHNQRVERLWKDMHQCVTVLLYHLFYHLDHTDLLNSANEVYLYALQYIYLPRINKALTELWMPGEVGTQRANQLFTQAMLMLRDLGLTAMDIFDNVDEDYGILKDGRSSDGTLKCHWTFS